MRVWALLAVLPLILGGCKKPYRVGEYVMVDWEDDRPFAAYITDKVGTTHYRVHFDGYDCDQDVSLERIKGRVQGPVPLPTPGKLPCAHAAPAPSGSAPVVTIAAFKANDHVRVTWRGTIYSAIVLQVIDKNRFLVHYEGLESAWDETVTLDRIVGKRP
ncbi:MAG TPA: hypothetical protein VHW01_27010 [Polyangiaceae bacterium]|nr:hypothetical protein [Polyangiaceae bacterium]